MHYYKTIINLLYNLINISRILELLRSYLSFIQNNNRYSGHFFTFRSSLRKINVEPLKHIPQLQGLYSHIKPNWTSHYFSNSTLKEEGIPRNQNLYLIGSELQVYRLGDVFSEKKWFKIPFFFSKFNSLKKKSSLNHNNSLFLQKGFRRGEEAVGYLLSKNFLQNHSLYNTLAMTSLSDDDYVFSNKDDFVFFPYFTFKKLDIWSIFILFVYGIFEILLLFFFVKFWYGSIFDFFFFLSNNFFLISPYALLSSNSSTLYMVCFTLLIFLFFMNLITWLFPEDDEEAYGGITYDIEDPEVGVFPPTISIIGDFLYTVFYVLPMCILWVFFVSKIFAFIVIVSKIFLFPLVLLPVFLLSKLYNKIYNYWYTVPPHRFVNKSPLRKSLKHNQSIFYWNTKLHRENFLNNLFIKRTTDRFFNKSTSQFSVGDNNLRRQPVRLNRKNLFFWSHSSNLKKNRRDFLKILQWVNNNPILFLDEKQKQYFPRKKTYKIINPLIERFWLYTLLKFRASDEEIIETRYEDFIDDKELNKYQSFYLEKEEILERLMEKSKGLQILRMMHGFFKPTRFQFGSIWHRAQPFEFFVPESRINPTDLDIDSFRETKNITRRRFNSLGRARIHLAKQIEDDVPLWSDTNAYQVSTLYPQPLNFLTLNYNKRFLDLFLKGWHHKILKLFGTTMYSEITDYPEYYKYTFLKMPDKPYLRMRRLKIRRKRKMKGRKIRRIFHFKHLRLMLLKFASFLKRTENLSRSGRRVFGEYYFRSFLNKDISHGIFSKNYFDRNYLFADFLSQRNSQIVDRLLEKTVSSFFSDTESRKENVIFFPNLRLRQKLINNDKLSNPFFQRSIYDINHKMFMSPFYPFGNLDRKYYNKLRNKITNGKYYIKRYPEGIFEGQEIGTPFYKRHFISKYRLDLLKFIMQKFRSMEWEFLTFDQVNRKILVAFLEKRLRVKKYQKWLRRRLKNTFADDPTWYVNPYEEKDIHEGLVKKRDLMVNKLYSHDKSEEELQNLASQTDEEFEYYDEDDEDDEDEFVEETETFYLPYLHLLFSKREHDKIWSFFSKYQNDFLLNLIKTSGNPLIRSKYGLNTYLTLSPFFTLNKTKDLLTSYKSFWHNYRNLRKFESYFLPIWKERLEKKKYSNLAKIYNKKTFYFDVTNPLSKYRLSLINFFELEKSLGLTKHLSFDTKLRSHGSKFFFRKNLEFENKFLEENSDNEGEFTDLFSDYKYFLEYLKEKYTKDTHEISFFLKNDFSRFSKYFLFLKLHELYKARLMQKWFFFDTGTSLSNLHKKNMHFQGYSRFSQFQMRQKKRLTLLFSDYLQWKKWRFFEKAKLQKKILQLDRGIDSFKIFGKLNSSKQLGIFNGLFSKKIRVRLKKYLIRLKHIFEKKKLSKVVPVLNENNIKTLLINSHLLKKLKKKKIFKSKFLKPYLVDNFFLKHSKEMLLHSKKMLFSNYFKLLLTSYSSNNKKKHLSSNSILSLKLFNKFYYGHVLNSRLRNFPHASSRLFNFRKIENFTKEDVYEGLNTSLNDQKSFNLNFKPNLFNLFLDLNPSVNSSTSKKRLNLSFIPHRSSMLLYDLDLYYFYRKIFFRNYTKPVDKFFTNRILFSDRYFAHNDQNSAFFNRKSFLNKRFLFAQNNYFGFIFQNTIPLLTELNIKKDFFSQFNRILLQSIYFSIYDNKLIKKNDNFDIGFFYYNVYNLLLRKYINYIFANQHVLDAVNKKKKIIRLKNLFLLLKLRDVKQFSTKKDKNSLNNFYFNYYSSLQKISIPFSRFIFWLLRNEKINTSLIQNMKKLRFNRVNKHFFSLNYPTLFVDKIIKNKKFFFLYGKTNGYSKIFSKKLWDFLLKESFFPLSFLSNTVRKRLIVYRKQRKLYKQFVLPYLLNLPLLKDFMLERRKMIRWEEFPRKTSKFTYSKMKTKDLLNIRAKKLRKSFRYNLLLNKNTVKYFFNRKFLHQFLNGIHTIKEKDKITFSKFFSSYMQYPKYRIQFFFRSLIINTYLMRLLDINNSIYNLRLMEKNSDFFPYKPAWLVRDFPHYTKYIYFLNHIFPFRSNWMLPEINNNKIAKEKFFSSNDFEVRNKKEKFLRRKLQYLKRYFLTNTYSSINLRQIDKYVFIKKFKKLRKFRKFDYVLNNLLELPLKRKNLTALQDFYFDWNYSFFDLISANRKQKMNLIKKHFLNTYPGIQLPISSFGNKQTRSLLSLNNSIFLNSIKSQHGVEVYPRYSSYNTRNRFFDSAYKNNNLLLKRLNKVSIDDPYKIQRYLKFYNLVGKRFNFKRRENLKYAYPSFWKLKIQDLLQHVALHYDISQTDKHLFVNDWNSYMFKNSLTNERSALSSGNFFVQPREYASLYYFLNPSFNKKFLRIYDKFFKNKNFLNLRSDLPLNVFIDKHKGGFWKLLHTKFKYKSYLNFLLWIRRKYGKNFVRDFKKNNFLWKDSFGIHRKPEFRSLFQRTHRVHYKSFFSPKRKMHSGSEDERHWHRTKASVVFLQPSAAFSDGKIKIPSDKIRPKFFILRQSILRKLRKAIFAFKASTGFLYFNYKIKEWNDRLVPHVRTGDTSRFLDLELEESIISRTNDLFLPAYKTFKFPTLSFLDKYSTVLNKITDASLHFSNSYMDGLILRLHSFWNRVSFLSHEEYTNKDNKNFLNLIARQDSNFTFFSKKNYSFYNTEMFFGESLNDAIQNNLTINSFLESDLFLAEQFRMLAYEEILKYSKQYETLVLTRKYQHFTDLQSILEKNVFFQKNVSELLNLQLKNIYELEPFFSSLYYGLELRSPFKLEIMQRSFFDHFFNLVNAETDLSLFLKTNLFNHFNKWFFLEKQSNFIFFRDIKSFFYKNLFFDDLNLFRTLNFSSSRYFSQPLLNDSSGFFTFLEHFFIKMCYIFVYVFNDSLIFSHIKYIFNFDWVYSSNFFFFLINFGVYFFFFVLYFVFVFLYFFWLKKERFQKNPFFFNNFSDQIKNVPFGWDWQIMKGFGALRKLAKIAGLKKPTKIMLKSQFKNENAVPPNVMINGWVQHNFFDGSGFFDQDHNFDPFEDYLFEQGNDSEYFDRNNDKLNIFYKILTKNDIQNREVKLRNLSLKNNRFRGFARTLYNGKILSYKLKFFHTTFNAKPSKKSILFNPNLNLFSRNLFVLETLRRQFFFKNFLKNSSFSLIDSKKNMWTKAFPFINRNGDLVYQQNLFLDKIFGNYFGNLLTLNFERFIRYLKHTKLKYNFITSRRQKMGLLKFGKKGKINKFKKIFPLYIRKAFNKTYNSYRLTGNVFYFLYKKRFNYSNKIFKKFYHTLQYKEKRLPHCNYIFLSIKIKNFIKLSKIQKIKRLNSKKKYFLQLLFVSEKRNFNLNPYFHFFRFFPFFFKNKLLDVFSFDSLDNRPSLVGLQEYDLFISNKYNRSFFGFRETLLDKQHYSWSWFDTFLVATFFYFKFLVIVFLSFIAAVCFIKFFVPFFIFAKFWLKIFL